MKRDWDMLREQMLRIEAWPEEKPFESPWLGMWNSAPVRRYDYHLELLRQAGFLFSTVAPEDGFRTAYRLTFDGQEALEMIRDDAVWVNMKGRAAAAGVGLTMDVIRLLASKPK